MLKDLYCRDAYFTIKSIAQAGEHELNTWHFSAGILPYCRHQRELRHRSFDWSVVLASPWLIMGLANFTVLLGLDAWLNRKRFALTAR